MYVKYIWILVDLQKKKFESKDTAQHEIFLTVAFPGDENHLH